MPELDPNEELLSAARTNRRLEFTSSKDRSTQATRPEPSTEASTPHPTTSNPTPAHSDRRPSPPSAPLPRQDTAESISGPAPEKPEEEAQPTTSTSGEPSRLQSSSEPVPQKPILDAEILRAVLSGTYLPSPSEEPLSNEGCLPWLIKGASFNKKVDLSDCPYTTFPTLEFEDCDFPSGFTADNSTFVCLTFTRCSFGIFLDQQDLLSSISLKNATLRATSNSLISRAWLETICSPSMPGESASKAASRSPIPNSSRPRTYVPASIKSLIMPSTSPSPRSATRSGSTHASKSMGEFSCEEDTSEAISLSSTSM